MGPVERIYRNSFIESEKAREIIHNLKSVLDYEEALEYLNEAEDAIKMLSRYLQREEIKAKKEDI